MTGRKVAIDRLYGCEWDEFCETDPETVVQLRNEPEGEIVEVREYTIHPPSYHLPDPSRLLDAINDMVDEVSTDGQPYIPVGASITALAQQFLDGLASHIWWMQTDRHVATHRYRMLDCDGNYELIETVAVTA